MKPLPENLRPFETAIEATRRPFLAARFAETASGHTPRSQLGGRAWWPIGADYPRDTQGRDLYLLIQIDFSETPQLTGFPTTGILQIFIGAGDFYGANFEDLRRPTGFACIYHSDLTQSSTTTAGPVTALVDPDLCLPLQHPLQPRHLMWDLGEMAIDASDCRFTEALPVVANDDELTSDYHDWQSADVSAIRVGGYPTLTQTDPRERDPSLGDITLVTIDTTDGIMWGDSGVAQFFIQEADLAQRDFSKVVYNWDCC